MCMTNVVLEAFELGFPWRTRDPFLFCVHHLDQYPKGNAAMGPNASLAGRRIGMDFDGKDGWSMYHGDVVPGFPRHPHRGFETISITRQGLIDHADSLGATARFGEGDVQWMTAGRGIVHSEMFPLLKPDGPNPGELFQIWLNLPRASKMVPPYFSMLWNHRIPKQTRQGAEVALIAGALPDVGQPPAPPPDSWAAQPDSDVTIWTLKLEPSATFGAPPTHAGTHRTLYFFKGPQLELNGEVITQNAGLAVRPDVELELRNPSDQTIEALMLQGKPIGEPVAHYGPFVMNTKAELQQAFIDYQRTQFGGWPWNADGPVHPRDKGRFALHADGRTDEPGR